MVAALLLTQLLLLLDQQLFVDTKLFNSVIVVVDSQEILSYE